MRKGENITRIVVEDILGTFNQKAEKDGPVSAQDADECGDEQRQYVPIQMVAFQGLLDGLVSGEQHVSMSSHLRLSSHFAGPCVVQLNPMEVQADALGRDASSVATTWGFMVKLPPISKGITFLSSSRPLFAKKWDLTTCNLDCMIFQ
jgi:hypothetical protein